MWSWAGVPADTHTPCWVAEKWQQRVETESQVWAIICSSRARGYLSHLLYIWEQLKFLRQKLKNGFTAGDERWRAHSVTPADENRHCLVSIRALCQKWRNYRKIIGLALIGLPGTYTPKGGHRRSKRRTKLYKGGQKTRTLTLNSPFGVCSSSSNQTKLANCKLRNKTVPGKSRENQLLQCS